jgi:elongation factor Ts
MKTSLGSIKELRKITSASISDCQKAIQDSGGDIQKAVELLRKRGLEIAAQKQDRIAKQGRIEAYVHLGNKIGVLLEVDCETDFVAQNSDFAQFAKDVAMQIAASSPLYISKEEVPQNIIKETNDQEQFYKENCLLEQVFIKDPNITMKDYLGSLVAKIGENVVIRRFIRYKVGE